MLASEAGNLEAVEQLLTAGFTINQQASDKKIAADLAWENQHQKVLLALLRANSKYPSNFDSKNTSNELEEFILQSMHFHKCVRDENFDEIKSFIDENAELSHIFNLENVSAAAYALHLKKFKVYEILLAKNVFFATHEKLPEIILNYSDEDRQKLFEIHEDFVNITAKKNKIEELEEHNSCDDETPPNDDDNDVKEEQDKSTSKIHDVSGAFYTIVGQMGSLNMQDDFEIISENLRDLEDEIEVYRSFEEDEDDENENIEGNEEINTTKNLEDGQENVEETDEEVVAEIEASLKSQADFLGDKNIISIETEEEQSMKIEELGMKKSFY